MVKNLEKKTFFGTKKPMILKLGIQLRVLKYYQISSNEDTRLTLPIFMTWSNLFHDASAWVKLIQHIVIYFEDYSNSAYPMHSGERYRTVWSSGLYVFQLLRQCFNTLLKNLLPILVEKYIVVSPDIKLNTNVFSFLVSCFS